MLQHMLLLCGLALAAPAGAAPGAPKPSVGKLSAEDGPALARAREALEANVAALQSGTGGRPQVQAARRALATIEDAVDLYFHAAEVIDPAKSGPAAALRAEVQRLWGGERPVLVLQDDVWHFRPDIHRLLALAARDAGDRAAEIVHLREIQAVEGASLSDLAAVRAAYLALGKSAEAEAVGTEISARQTAELSDSPAIR